MFVLGSGGGWNSSLSLSANFSEIYPAYQNGVNRTQPTGFSSHWSWIGGWPCSPNSNQYGIHEFFYIPFLKLKFHQKNIVFTSVSAASIGTSTVDLNPNRSKWI